MDKILNPANWQRNWKFEVHPVSSSEDTESEVTSEDSEGDSMPMRYDNGKQDREQTHTCTSSIDRLKAGPDDFLSNTYGMTLYRDP